MSTHILADVERICDTVGIIDHGRLVTEGATRSELLARYHMDTFAIEVAIRAGTCPVSLVGRY